MKLLFRLIGWLIKSIWKTITFIRVALINVVFLLSIVLIYFAYLHNTDEKPTITHPSALVLNLSGPIVEQRSYLDPLDSVTGSMLGKELPKENVLFDIVNTLRYAKNDRNISGLVLSLKELPETNLTKLRYIAKAIDEFKTSGKPVYAIGDFYNQSQYYLASYADKIYLAPNGAVLLQGYSSYNLYFKNLLEKLDINTHVFRVGTYKSAVEPFTRNDMSAQAKESTSRWLTQLWAAYVEDVAKNRHIETSALNPSMEEFLTLLKGTSGDFAQLALQLGLVDKLATRQEMHNMLTNAFGYQASGYHSINYYQYRATMSPVWPSMDPKIAVVVASGTIMDGEQPRGTIGGETLAGLLRQARLDQQIKAVVLRIDSPGGSAFASEVIRNEVEQLKAAGKPVVVSMSSLAASGGYWIALAGNKIVAQPTTLTGSIGVFSVITTFEKGLNKLGIVTDGVGTSPFSSSGLTTGLDQGVKQVIQLGIEHGYQRFISLVAQARHLSLDDVDKIAQGRVWTAQDALELGLIDKLGDFDDAVILAAELAALENYQLDWVEEALNPWQLFMQELANKAQVSLGSQWLSALPLTWQPAAQQLVDEQLWLNQLNDPQGQYTFCLPCQVN